jgi:2-keto-3-deoxy-6-phosphogluconate aldolase
MLVELSVVEQRYQAVQAVIRDGVPVVEVASGSASVLDVMRSEVRCRISDYTLPGQG